MRYRSDHKAQSREAILRASLPVLKSNGVNGIGVDGLSAAAGMTSGAFYSNFPSKHALLEAIVEMDLGASFPKGDTSPAAKRETLRQVASAYLDVDHRNDPSKGCLLPALSADIARAGASVQKAYDRKMRELVARIADAFDGRKPVREQKAWSLVSTLVGAVIVSRALPDGVIARQVLNAARETVLAVIENG